MRNIILYRKNWSTRIFLISLLMFDGKFGQIKHIIYRLALPSALFGIEMFTICWNFQNCIFVCYHIWRHILPWWRFEQFHVDWVPLVNKTCINTIFWKKDDRYTIQKFSRCFVVSPLFRQGYILSEYCWKLWLKVRNWLQAKITISCFAVFSVIVAG